MSSSDRDAPNEPAENKSAPITPTDDTRPAPEVDTEQIERKVRRAFELVPPIGEGWRRWYDLPYRLLNWLLFSWPRRLLHWRLIPRLGNALNYLGAFNHYERLKVEPLDDPMENLVIPEGEEVTQGGIWVVEFFPPSCFSSLTEALAKNGWDEPSRMYGFDDGTNAQKVTLARRGKGFSWSNIGAVADPKSRYSSIDAKHEVLPEEFRLIQLTAVQLGQSLTAVTAFFRLSDRGQEALNNVWKAQHEPTFEWQGLRPPHSEPRLFAAIRATQRERKRLHDLARSWLADRCGGFFSTTKAGQPVVDFTMFAKFDPTAAAPTRELGDPLRALGMEGDHVFNYISPQLPGAVLVRGESLRPYDSEDLTNCWGLVGAYEVFADHNDEIGHGQKPYSVATLGAMSDDAIRDFLLNVAAVRYTEQLSEIYSDARDTAQRKHREFKPRKVEKLRRELLTTSLDLPVVARDTAFLWEPAWRLWNGIDVKAVSVPGDLYPEEGFDLIKEFEHKSNKAFEQLVRDDVAYRDVLSTASALGASAASARLGRRALFVSGTSLLVSVVSVLTADHASAWHHISVVLSDLRHFWLDHAS
ncbi:MAG TPA: hypothetical protein VGG53_08105 [Mycobacterium sp.]|uniref:hypothetical protein n=1 Tax=Mycobacterium sp. TaxID=1785 RepID=UPI002F3F4A11